MTEFLGLAAIAEIPLVIADIQRVGPSTGIPTKTEQCDFAHAAHAGPGTRRGSSSPLRRRRLLPHGGRGVQHR